MGTERARRAALRASARLETVEGPVAPLITHSAAGGGRAFVARSGFVDRRNTIERPLEGFHFLERVSRKGHLIRPDQIRNLTPNLTDADAGAKFARFRGANAESGSRSQRIRGTFVGRDANRGRGVFFSYELLVT